MAGNPNKNILLTVFLLGGALMLVKDSSGFKTPPLNDLPKDFDAGADSVLKRDQGQPYTYGKPVEFFHSVLQTIIEGKEMETINNKTIYAFQGFRYGLKPTNETRFKPPTAAGRYWKEGRFVANHIGAKCPQGSIIASFPSGDEDCLFLNVYTPTLPNPLAEKIAVMFFIHGGSFTSGDASYYLPTKLLDRNVILVTIHYRLGALGFFTLNNADAPGNAALYDMVEALRWVQEYIGDFGGDKDRVTIHGESAGSVSVNYLMIVEPARGLFSGVIADSGSCLDHWAIDEDPTYAATFLSNYTGCGDDLEDPGIYDCMANADVYDLVNAERALVSSDRRMGLLGFRGSAPTIQTFEDPELTFIVTKHPRQYFLDRDFSDVPFMTGSNKQEGSFVLSVGYDGYLKPNGLDQNSTYLKEQLIPDILASLGIVDDAHGIANTMQQHYCYDVDMGNFNESAPCLIDMMGVLYLKSGSWETSSLHSLFSTSDTFYYAFEFESDDSLGSFESARMPFDMGVTHADELLYLFAMPAIMDTPGQVTTMNRLVTLWTNFAIYGHPTPPEDLSNLEELGIPYWEPYQFDDHRYILIQDSVTLEKEYTDRWTITMDDIRASSATPTSSSIAPTKSTFKTTSSSSTAAPICDSECQNNLEQRDAFMGAMIAFVVVSVILAIVATYFFFKARR